MIAKDQWVFVAAVLRNGTTGKGELRLMADDRVFDLGHCRWLAVPPKAPSTIWASASRVSSTKSRSRLCALLDSEIQTIRQAAASLASRWSRHCADESRLG